MTLGYVFMKCISCLFGIQANFTTSETLSYVIDQLVRNLGQSCFNIINRDSTTVSSDLHNIHRHLEKETSTFIQKA